MAQVELQQSAPGRLSVRGPLTFVTARSARDAGLAALREAGPQQVQIDCGGITSADSAGMTVLLDWLAAARRSGRSLHFTGLPEQLKAIAEISEVRELLEKGV